MKTVLIVDDDKNVRESIRMILKDSYDLRFAEDGRDAVRAIANDSIELVILDILMPSGDGLTVLREIKKRSRASVIMLTGINKVRTAVEAMKMGAADYIVKPFETEELKLIVERIISLRKKDEELDYLRSEIGRSYPTNHMVVENPVMKQLLARVKKVSATISTVLITGESGTGKELVARAIHQNSARADRPFIALQCAAIPEGILESELFGHEKGAFTGATSSRIGMFELADSGTLFLDEISEMSLAMQVKVLRSLQEKEFMRVGGRKPVKIDVRLIAATNRNLRERINEGVFREDLYYRLNVIPLHIPPLRKRREDIRPLAEYYLHYFNRELHASSKRISAEAVEILEKYPWPGNVRELKNVIERSVTLEPSVLVMRPSHFHLDWSGNGEDLLETPLQPDFSDSLEDAESELEKRFILEALHASSWNQTKAADRLRITRRKLKYRMDKLGIIPRKQRGRPHRQFVAQVGGY